jgi:quercetin dioxygenase-like cupin family protein
MPALEKNPLHLGRGATAVVQPAFTGEMDWYVEYGARHGGDGAEGRLVSLHSFDQSWDSWEMHPSGDEVVLCTAGEITLHQEMEGGELNSVTLGPGEYVINPPGIWHTADVRSMATALFITAGLGTEHRPREPHPVGVGLTDVSKSLPKMAVHKTA